MMSTTPLAGPRFVRSWYMIHGLNFYLIRVIRFGRGRGQCLVCFRHLYFISAERAGSGRQEGQRNSHSHSRAKPGTSALKFRVEALQTLRAGAVLRNRADVKDGFIPLCQLYLMHRYHPALNTDSYFSTQNHWKQELSF